MIEQPPALPPPSPAPPPRGRFATFGWVCVVMAVTSILYRLLVVGHLEQSALMFIGLPTVLAILLGALPPAKSATGMIIKGVTLFLLLLGILYIEGFVCILMAAPFFYAIGIVVGLIIDVTKSRREWNNRFRVIVFPALALMSLEGVTGILSFPRDETVTVSRKVSLTPVETRAALAKGPDFDLEELPGFLKLGFPQPTAIIGGGLETGDTWRISFAGGEGKPGDLFAEVTESTADRIRVECISDTSHIAHWLAWDEAVWKLEPTGDGTRVTLTMRYRRLLDPAWYFKPIERFGVGKAGEYFMEQTFGGK